MQGSAASIDVYLTVANAVAAVEFYKAAFGADVAFIEYDPEGKRVMHAVLKVFGGQLLLSDHFPEMLSDVTPAGPGIATNVSVSVNFAQARQVDDAVARATAAGATVTMAPWDSYWITRFARVRDPFGLVWSFSAPLSLDNLQGAQP